MSRCLITIACPAQEIQQNLWLSDFIQFTFPVVWKWKLFMTNLFTWDSSLYRPPSPLQIWRTGLAIQRKDVKYILHIILIFWSRVFGDMINYVFLKPGLKCMLSYIFNCKLYWNLDFCESQTLNLRFSLKYTTGQYNIPLL